MGRIVIAAYRPKPGKGPQLAELMKTHLPVLRGQGLVTARQSIMMTAKDGTVLEVFEWASKAAIEQAHTNPEVLRMWEAFGEVCDYIPAGQVAEVGELFSEFTPLDPS